MIRTVIVDDEGLAIKRLQIKLARHKDIEIVGVARDGDAAEKLLQSLSPDLLILDIGMPGKDGLEVAQTAIHHKTHIIFVTAFQQYAVKAFERNAVDYLLKPIDSDRLERALEKYRTVRQQGEAMEKIEELESVVTQLRHAAMTPNSDEKPHFFWNQDNGITQKIRFGDIDWVQAARDYILLHMDNGRTHLVRHTLYGFEELLDSNQFQRVHRSSIVNILKINKIIKRDDTLFLTTRAGHEIRVGRSYRQETSLKLKQLPNLSIPKT